MQNSSDSASTSFLNQGLLNFSCSTSGSDSSLPFVWPIGGLSSSFPPLISESILRSKKTPVLFPQTFKTQSSELNTNSSTWHPRPHSPLPLLNMPPKSNHFIFPKQNFHVCFHTIPSCSKPSPSRSSPNATSSMLPFLPDSPDRYEQFFKLLRYFAFFFAQHPSWFVLYTIIYNFLSESKDNNINSPLILQHLTYGTVCVYC